jgi:restriction system protein
MDLPIKEEVSDIKGYKEYKRERRFEPILYNDRDYQKVYSKILYSVVFRILKEVYLSDYNSIINTVTINGWVNIPNKKNGKFENRCILSITISRDKFEDIDYNHIDLKLAFEELKGISAANLSEYTPIAPLVIFDKKDNRFIQSEEVLKNIDTSTNLASVDWEAFEHLVRELFEKEFAHNGGEVKVTQSSRDGGVDAIAFDPDPIRGGKIVIQSKRYTNVVGVSAIRDLYGTVMNEGATKGIIVTTSHYGNDAYEFAKGKPLTLLDGNNLLALLQKHGYNARINIAEAKEQNKISNS